LSEQHLGGQGSLLAEFVITLANGLRENGVKCGSSETIDGLTAVLHTEIGMISELREVLRISMVKRFEDYQIFDAVFEGLLRRKTVKRESGSERPSGSPSGEAEKPRSSGSQHSMSRLAFYSPLEVLTRRSIPVPARDSLREMKRVIRRMKRRLALLPGRRMIHSVSGEVDFPTTLRSSLGTFGEQMSILHMRRKVTRCRLVALFDVSGSMDTYTGFLMQSMYALARQGVALEVFIFSTALVRVTELLRYYGPEVAARAISTDIRIWGSGTRIGNCLKQFHERYGGILTRGTVVLIVSDGWDTGEPELLERSMKQLKSKAGRLVWVNPHADKPGFKPRTLGMETAMPYIDLLVGMSALAELRAFRRYFGLTLDPIRRKPHHFGRSSPTNNA